MNKYNMKTSDIYILESINILDKHLPDDIIDIIITKTFKDITENRYNNCLTQLKYYMKEYMKEYTNKNNKSLKTYQYLLMKNLQKTHSYRESGCFCKICHGYWKFLNYSVEK